MKLKNLLDSAKDLGKVIDQASSAIKTKDLGKMIDQASSAIKTKNLGKVIDQASSVIKTKDLGKMIDQASSAIDGLKRKTSSVGVVAPKKSPAKKKVEANSDDKPEEHAPEEVSSLIPVTESAPAPLEIKSLDGMTNWLQSLQSGASQSVQSALQAQMQVIQFVQAPTLIDTTIDTLVLYLKKSLDSESLPERKEQLSQSFSLMIQNYVFFLDARLQMEIKNHNDEAMHLCDMAGEMLSQSVVNVATLAIPGGAISKVSRVVVRNVFSQDNNEEGFTGFISKVVKWFTFDEEGKLDDFYRTIYSIISKLDRYCQIIGPSMLISSMIERYTPELVDFEFSQTSNHTYKPKLWNDDSLLKLRNEIKWLTEDLNEMKRTYESEFEGKMLIMPAKRRAKKELEAKIDECKQQIKSKKRQADGGKKMLRTKFKEHLHAIAEKFNEL